MAWSEAARAAALRARLMRRNTYPKRDGLGASSRPAIAAGIRLLRKGGLSTAKRMEQFERVVAKRGARTMMTDRLGKKKMVTLKATPAYNAGGSLVGWKDSGPTRAARRRAFKAAGRNAVANKNRNP